MWRLCEKETKLRVVAEKKTRIQMLGVTAIERILANNARESNSNGSISSDASSGVKSAR